MALEFTGGDADRVDCGSGATLDDITAGTVLMWVYMDGFGSQFRWFMKKNGGSDFVGYWEMSHSGAGALNFVIDYNTTDLEIVSSDGDLGTGKWIFIGASFDASSTNTNQKLWIGDLTTSAAEPGAYATQQASSGTIVSNASGTLKWGNRNGADRSIDGRIAWAAIWSGTTMTQAQVRAQQFSPHITADGNCVIFMHLGYNGTGTQPDWSGNSNAGTVTGATVADHVPLGPFFGFDLGWAPTTVAAVAGQPMMLRGTTVPHIRHWQPRTIRG